MSEPRCTLCKNRCPLSNPKCSAGRDQKVIAQRAAAEQRAAQTCRLCEKHCPFDALECSLGQTIHGIKTRASTNG